MALSGGSFQNATLFRLVHQSVFEVESLLEITEKSVFEHLRRCVVAEDVL